MVTCIWYKPDPRRSRHRKKAPYLRFYHLKERSTVLLQGRAVGTKIGVGKAHVIKEAKDLNDFQAGEVLIADTTTRTGSP